MTSGSIVRASVAAALLVLGCGGGTDPADAFVGTRTFMFSGIDSAGPCVPGGSDVLIDLSGAMMTITKDDRTDITATFAANGAACDLGFTVRGAGATVKTGQSCSISDAAMSGTFEITSGSLNLYSTFLLLSLDGGFVPAGATSATCLLSAADTLPAP